MSEKLCVFCTHFKFTNDYGHEYADGASAQCGKLHYAAYDASVFDQDDLRRVIIRAETCPDYDQVEL